MLQMKLETHYAYADTIAEKSSWVRMGPQLLVGAQDDFSAGPMALICAAESLKLISVDRNRQNIFKRFDKLLSLVDLESVDACHNDCFDIGIHQVFMNDEGFTENIKLPVAADEPDQDDVAILDIV